MERYRFVKAFNSHEGTIPQGSEITIMDNGAVYFNGGLVHSAYQSMLKSMVTNENMRKEYLVKTEIPFNKV